MRIETGHSGRQLPGDRRNQKIARCLTPGRGATSRDNSTRRGNDARVSRQAPGWDRREQMFVKVVVIATKTTNISIQLRQSLIS